MNRCYVILLALAAGLGSAAARAELTDPAQIQTEAYINLVQADQSLDAGRLDEALTQYQAARDYYLRLAKDFPGWEPRVIQYRKTYCDNQIADVERRRSGGLPAELPEPEPLLYSEFLPENRQQFFCSYFSSLHSFLFYYHLFNRKKQGISQILHLEYHLTLAQKKAAVPPVNRQAQQPLKLLI